MKSDLLQIIFVGFVIAAMASLFVTPYRIDGESMKPTLKPNQIVLVDKLSYRINLPKVGDVVIAKTPIGTVAKRITKIEVVQDGYWLEGDNKDFSTDSREFGSITKKQIVGKVIGI